MSEENIILRPLKHYADFLGRSTRQEFWIFVTLSHLLVIALLTPAYINFMQFTHDLMKDASIVMAIEAVLSGTLTELNLEMLKQLVHDKALLWYATPYTDFPFASLCTLLAAAVVLFIFIPSLSITARRLRDAGMSPWWTLTPIVCFIPLLQLFALPCSIVLLVLTCLPSKKAV